MNLRKELKRNSIEVASWPAYLRDENLESFDDETLEGSIDKLERMVEERAAILRRRRTYKALGLSD